MGRLFFYGIFIRSGGLNVSSGLAKDLFEMMRVELSELKRTLHSLEIKHGLRIFRTRMGCGGGDTDGEGNDVWTHCGVSGQ